MIRRAPILVLFAAVVAVAGLLSGNGGQAASQSQFTISILSSSPDMVTGGDALVRVDAPDNLSFNLPAQAAVNGPGQVVVSKLRVTLNGVDVTDSFAPVPGENAIAGVVEGFVIGANLLQLKAGSGTTLASLDVTNYPITGPVFSGPQQQPFLCNTVAAGLGPPLVDNMEGRGFPVVVGGVFQGWSEFCHVEPQFDYFYRNTSGAVLPLPVGPVPADVAKVTLLDGTEADYIIRWERGTINRFLYSIAMLAPPGDDPLQPDNSLWNERLVYSFQGGVGIGRFQGSPSTGAMLLDHALSRGYAVVWSSGTRTSTHYNLQVGGETALMVKERFIVRHGVPLYTVGVGGSGGAIQQYVYGQNHDGLLDAAVPQYSYPDMVTQTVHIGDCELLEHYFDVTDGANPKWLDVENRRAIMGLNASREPQNLSTGTINQFNGISGLYALFGLPVPIRDNPAIPALTECRAGWFGLTPLALNHLWAPAPLRNAAAAAFPGVDVHWTHWEDAVNIYGRDADGFARVPWDNAGVQYGLEALRDGAITSEEFLHLNAFVGSWKEQGDIVQEGFPFEGAPAPPPVFDPWSSRNMNLSPDGVTPAPRREGDVQAMNAAYEVGKVFDGHIDIPIIDWRHYLEHELDMHHSHQSFAARQRIADAKGHHDNQLIWFTDGRPSVMFDQTPEAFMVIDQWMANIKANPHLSVAENKPADAVDRCFDVLGDEIARGDGVWDGILNDSPDGACTQEFEIYASSRIVSGGPIRGGVFKCQLQSVDDAIAKGLYGSWVPDAAEKARLEEIFPTGVCDYDLPDDGRPTS